MQFCYYKKNRIGSRFSNFTQTRIFLIDFLTFCMWESIIKSLSLDPDTKEFSNALYFTVRKKMTILIVQREIPHIYLYLLDSVALESKTHPTLRNPIFHFFISNLRRILISILIYAGISILYFMKWCGYMVYGIILDKTTGKDSTKCSILTHMYKLLN